jgi:hypothetical protein
MLSIMLWFTTGEPRLDSKLSILMEQRENHPSLFCEEKLKDSNKLFTYLNT